MPSLTFLGAARSVTGSKYLLEAKGSRVLVDCGLFQGLKELRERNWQALPVPAESIDSVVLTHAHIDHSGYLPRLFRDGFRGRVFCTPATADLCQIVLPDSGRLAEEDAREANRHGYSRPTRTACSRTCSRWGTTARSRRPPTSRSASSTPATCSGRPRWPCRST
ncbi:MAG: mRNA 3'-end processing factor [Acidobacteria bacterium]|nr:mRNA 3'-end processing factor [Acidobacteriota bacterium]